MAVLSRRCKGGWSRLSRGLPIPYDFTQANTEMSLPGQKQVLHAFSSRKQLLSAAKVKEKGVG